VRNRAPRSVAKGRRVMTNEATPAILTLITSYITTYKQLLIKQLIKLKVLYWNINNKDVRFNKVLETQSDYNLIVI